jgi:hypothetical protein
MLRRASVLLGFATLLTMVACFVEKIPGRYCNSVTDCTESGYPKCDTGAHTCVPDSVDTDLGTGGNDMTMIGCSTSSTCPASEPVCSPLQVCSSCGATGMSTECNTYHPTTPLCGPNGGCVECLTKDNCDAVHKTCSPTNMCVPCVNNADCTSGLCNAGVCADKGSLLYVNNAPSAGCSDSGSGAFAMPFCTVQKGLNAGAAAAKQVVVFSGTYPENLTANNALNGGNDYVVTVIGIGNPVVKPSASGAVLSVSGAQPKQVTVSFDGFTFDGSTLADGSDGVDCIGGAAAVYGKTLVTITRSTVKGASGIGLLAQAKCTITLDADIFFGNKGGAIKTDTCDLAFTNLLIHDNGTAGASGSTFGGVLFSAAGETNKTSMFNLTVVNNVAATTAGASGILCLAAPSAVTNTVVLGNTGPATEISAACGANFSAFVGGTGSNNVNIPVTGCGVSDLLINPSQGDFHPKKGGAKPCTLIDQGTNTNAPNHDLDGTSRPQPASGTDDIGCYEAK